MITWIASYPKSGNTWVRSFLSNYLSDNEDFNFKQLKRIKKFPSEALFEELNVNQNNAGDIAANWIPMQSIVNLKNKLTYLKTHNAMMTINNHKFTNADNTNGFIYLVRDPRDVLISYTSHMSISLETTLNIMTSDLAYGNQDKVIMSTWANHYNSWKNSSFPKIIIKYEDLVEDSENNFNKIIAFLNKINNLPIDKEKIKRCIVNSNFDSLKKLEQKEGFDEATKNAFFRKGKVGQWKEVLDKKTTKKIEDSFNKEMKDLGYL